MVSDKKFAEVMEAFAEIYADAPRSPVAMKMYKTIFDKNFHTDIEFEMASLKIIEERVYPSFPKPGEFIQIMKPKKEDLEVRVALGVVDIKEAVRKYGAYTSVAFEDFVIHQVIKYGVGSWVKVCKMSLKELDHFLKWEFPKLYRVYSERKGVEMPLYLEGISESKNSTLGYNSPQIAYVGDRNKTKRWQTSYTKKNLIAIPESKLKKLGYEIPKQLVEIKELSETMTAEDCFKKYIS